MSTNQTSPKAWGLVWHASQITSPNFILQQKKPRSREGNWLAQGHTASWEQTPVPRNRSLHPQCTVPSLHTLVVVLRRGSALRKSHLQCRKQATKLFVSFDLVPLLMRINTWKMMQRKGGKSSLPKMFIVTLLARLKIWTPFKCLTIAVSKL